MKSRKGEYYIACNYYGELHLRKEMGYILDDGKNLYGMCRGEDAGTAKLQCRADIYSAPANRKRIRGMVGRAEEKTGI